MDLLRVVPPWCCRSHVSESGVFILAEDVKKPGQGTTHLKVKLESG